MTRGLRSIMAGVAVAAAVCVGMTVPASSAGATNYQYPANTLSPQFKNGTCVYRIWYGNFGNVAFAKVRFYSGNCGGTVLTGLADSGSGTYGYAGTSANTGSDSCGSYIELQNTAGANSVGVGENIVFGETGTSHTFRYNTGTGTTTYNYC